MATLILTIFLNFSGSLNDFFSNRQGITAVEYSVIIFAIASVVSVVFGDSGVYMTIVSHIFNTVFSALQSLSI